MEEFSPRTREDNLARMAAEAWDLLVIGGGIVGAGIARDAAMRKVRVALVEKTDFAAGTSGRTSKLIHGGLRYLEDLRFGLVKQAIRERDLWLKAEPRLVRPLAFLIPAHRGGDSSLKIRIGLRVYDWFSRTRALGRGHMLSRGELAVEEPALAPPGLRGAGRYFDACVADSRLVIETIRSAASSGACVVNHAEVVALVMTQQRVAGARVRDALTGREILVRSRIVVNAAGPWLDKVRALAGPLTPRLRPTKGIHILVPRTRIGHRHAIALRAAGGRLVFILPWGSFSLVGTTDTDYRGDPDAARATEDEVAYLLSAANAAFPTANLTPEDVVSSYAGIRPLIDSGRPGAESDISREHEVLDDRGMIGIAGGKLTTHRAMAEGVVDRVTARLAAEGAGPFLPCRTATVPLRTPAKPEDAERLRKVVSNDEIADRLVSWYNPADLLAHMNERPETALILGPDVPYVWAEVDHAVQHEMACTLSDFMVRRTGTIHEVRNHGRTIALTVAARMAALLGWDRGRLRDEIAAYDAAVVLCVPIQGPSAR